MPESRIVESGGYPVRYKVSGKGEALVLLHGLAGSTRWWARNLPELEKHFTVYLFDFPGFGAMTGQRGRFSLGSCPAWLRSAFDTLGIARASLIGHSMGGLVATMFTARWPDAVERLVLAAPSIDLGRKTTLASIPPLLSASRYFSPAFHAVLAFDVLRAGPTTILRASNQLHAADVHAELAVIRCPTLLIWGEHDPLVPPAIGPRLAERIAGSELRSIKGAGHIVMHDRPREFNATVIEFLRRNRIPAGPSAVT